MKKKNVALKQGKKVREEESSTRQTQSETQIASSSPSPTLGAALVAGTAVHGADTSNVSQHQAEEPLVDDETKNMEKQVRQRMLLEERMMMKGTMERQAGIKVLMEERIKTKEAEDKEDDNMKKHGSSKDCGTQNTGETPTTSSLSSIARRLGPDYCIKLNRRDVILGRGSGTNNNKGNIEFRKIVEAYCMQPSIKMHV